MNRNIYSENYRFHSVKGATLSRLIRQTEGEQITLWGRVEDAEGYAGYEQGAGEISAVDVSSLELCFNSFLDENGMVLILEQVVEDPSEEAVDIDEVLLKCEEWNVIGGLRPVYDEEDEYQEEVLSHEFFSLSEMVDL